MFRHQRPTTSALTCTQPVRNKSALSAPIYRLENFEFIAARQREILNAAGAVEVWSQPTGGGLGVGQHQCGTCRMENDPKTSVLNPHCQTHDVDNLFVIDASCFVSFPGHNPSLTAQAIAYRSCEYIKTEWRRGAFRTKV